MHLHLPAENAIRRRAFILQSSHHKNLSFSMSFLTLLYLKVLVHQHGGKDAPGLSDCGNHGSPQVAIPKNRHSTRVSRRPSIGEKQRKGCQ